MGAGFGFNRGHWIGQKGKGLVITMLVDGGGGVAIPPRRRPSPSSSSLSFLCWEVVRRKSGCKGRKKSAFLILAEYV